MQTITFSCTCHGAASASAGCARAKRNPSAHALACSVMRMGMQEVVGVQNDAKKRCKNQKVAIHLESQITATPSIPQNDNINNRILDIACRVGLGLTAIQNATNSCWMMNERTWQKQSTQINISDLSIFLSLRCLPITYDLSLRQNAHHSKDNQAPKVTLSTPKYFKLKFEKQTAERLTD